MKQQIVGARDASLVCVAAALMLCPVALHAAGTVDPSTLDNKVLIGYQGWFTCPSDGSQRWTHWSRGVPSADTLTVELYPDLSELDADERCEVPGMTIGGKPAYLFSSRNQKTVSRHFRWMKEYGLDGVLVQRFVGGSAPTATACSRTSWLQRRNRAGRSPSSTTSRAETPRLSPRH
jgi:hypothetical protein